MTTTEQWLTANEVAKLLGISRATFYRIPFFRSRKKYPRPGLPRYSAADVATYQRVQSTRAAA